MYTFLARLCATNEPIVALVSVVRTTPSLQTTPIVVVPLSIWPLTSFLLSSISCPSESCSEEHTVGAFQAIGKSVGKSGTRDCLKTFSGFDNCLFRLLLCSSFRFLRPSFAGCT